MEAKTANVIPDLETATQRATEANERLVGAGDVYKRQSPTRSRQQWPTC